MCGTELLSLLPEGLLVEFDAGVALAWLALFETFEPPCPEPPPFPPEVLEELPVSEPLVLEEELGATGMVDSAVPLEPEELGLLLLPPPPTPGSADPYWSCEGELAPAVGASTAAKRAITAIAAMNLGM
jgi:hypothetical protein